MTPETPADSSHLQPLETSEAVGGLLALESGDELALGDAGDFDLALGDAGDYGDLAMGEADDGEAMVALTFGTSDTQVGGDAWDLGDIRELVVNEVKGDFGGDGGSARDDVMVMEEDFDWDAEVVDAVWEDDEGTVRMERRIRRTAKPKPVLLPYGVIAGVLLVLGGSAAVAVVALILMAALQGSPDSNTPVVIETDPRPALDEAKIEAAKQKTADEILQDVLGDKKKDE